MIELATTIMLLSSAFYGKVDASTDMASSQFARNAMVPREQVMMIAGETVRSDKPLTLEDHVREYFKESPQLAEIARCESGFRQFTPSGKVVRGRVNRYDIGVMQINELYHAEKAEELGYDIHTVHGNLAYAKWLYNSEGSKPWASSGKCWKQVPNDHLATISSSIRSN